MTVNVRPTLSQAMQALAGVCDYANRRDGAGFNASDAGVGHRLAETSPDRWSTRDHHSAYRLATKYRRQLGAYGIDVKLLPMPSAAPDDRALVARVAGPCAECGGTIAAGAAFVWGSAMGQRVHADTRDCVAPQPSDSYQSPPAACRLCGGVAERDGLCADCALDLVDLPATREHKPARTRPSLARDPEAVPPEPRSRFSGRELLGPGGVVAQALPGYQAREPQLQLVDVVEAAIRDGEHAAIEAGTGTGKSLGYMVPGLNSGHRCIVSTADKALQAQLVNKDVPFLKDVLPFDFTAALLKGRGNYVCRQRVAEIDESVRGGLGGEFGFRSKEAAQAWPDLRAWVDETDTGDLETVPFRVPGDLAQDVVVSSEECTGKKCPFYAGCFAEGAKARAKAADLVIVNHALLLRDAAVRAATGDMAQLLPDATVLLLDEAHHLADVARDSFAVEITQGRWARIVRRLERLTVKHPKVAKRQDGEPEEWQAERKGQAEGLMALVTAAGNLVESSLGLIGERLVKAKASAQRLGDERDLTATAGALLALRARLEEGRPSWLDGEAETEGWRKMVKAVEALGDDFQAVGAPVLGDAVVRYAELEGQGERQRVKLLCKPIDVSDLLRDNVFERFDSVVACSATIATHKDGRPSFDFWRAEVGCDDPRELVVSSPFDYARHALLYLPPNGEALDPTKFRQSGTIEYYERVAGEVERLILASKGRAFVLFTSYRMLQETHDRLAPRLRDRFLVLRQGDAMRPALVRQFKDDGNAVLFGTKSFWEGVDVQGEALSMVIIVGLPFAPPDDPMWSARCDAVERKGGKWFFDLAVPTAIIALKQGFGRLIRSVDDRGTVALLDGRLTSRRYGADIVRSMPPATQTRSIDAVRAFFGS